MKRTLVLTLAALGFTAAIGCSADTKAPTVAKKTSTATSTATRDDVPTAEPRYCDPARGDFKLTVKTLTKECFGSAGCVVTFRIKVAMVDVSSLDPDKTYEITYKIRGGDEPLTNTLEVTGEDYSTDKEEIIQTGSSSARLTAVVTDVEEV